MHVGTGRDETKLGGLVIESAIRVHVCEVV